LPAGYEEIAGREGWAVDGAGGDAPLDLAGPEEAALFELYQEEKGMRFPQVSSLQEMYFGLGSEREQAEFMRRFPALREYWNWKTAMQAEYPDLIPHLTSEESDLYGVPVETAQRVYEFRATREQYWPGIFEVQGGFFGLPEGQARWDYLDAHPELGAYWDWRRNVIEQYPEIEEFVTSQGERADMGEMAAAGLQAVGIDPGRLSVPLLSQVLRAGVTGEDLGSGAMMALRRLWEQDGSPGVFEDWVEGVVSGMR